MNTQTLKSVLEVCSLKVDKKDAVSPTPRQHCAADRTWNHRDADQR